MKGKTSIRIATTGSEKKGCTVALCVSANGNKRPAYVVFKEPKGVLGNRVLRSLRVPNNVLIDASLNGWMTTPVLHRWLRRVWGQNADDARRLLVLDEYKPHTIQETMTACDEVDTDLVHIPGGKCRISHLTHVSNITEMTDYFFLQDAHL